MKYIHKNTHIRFKNGKIHMFNNYDIYRTNCGIKISVDCIEVEKKNFKSQININDYCAKCFNL